MKSRVAKYHKYMLGCWVINLVTIIDVDMMPVSPIYWDDMIPDTTVVVRRTYRNCVFVVSRSSQLNYYPHC